MTESSNQCQLRRGIQRTALTALILFLFAGVTVAQETEVSYLEGFPELRAATGDSYELDFGDLIEEGDSVVTGRRDYVELAQGEGTTIRVEPDTVFTLREVEEGGERRSVMTSAVGSVSYRFNRLTGREPRVGSAAVVAGIRGTELTVYAGSDGSTLFLVDSGLVEVTSAGETVSLSEAQGVEVGAGQPPGEVFEWKGRELDFSSWDQERIEGFLEEPAQSVELLETRLQELAAGYEEYQEIANEIQAQIDQLRDDFEEAASEEEQNRIRAELRPSQDRGRTAVLNYRYYALSALSLRRYVLGNLYMQMKTRHMMDLDNPLLGQFLSAYEDFLSAYEERVVPGLVERDI